MKTLIVYFSYYPGNTKRIAERIHNTIGGEIVRLETVRPYPTDYNRTVSQGQNEVNQKYKPALKPLDIDMNDYDRIIVGSPTWWYQMAPAVFAFLSEADFTGKTVVPFMTDAGWPGNVLQDMIVLARKNGAKVEKSAEFRFSSDQSHLDRMQTQELVLSEWINSLK